MTQSSYTNMSKRQVRRRDGYRPASEVLPLKPGRLTPGDLKPGRL
jgi:hypothetical protein